MKSSRRCGGAVSISLRHATFNDIPTRCEQEAREHGFAHVELMATLPGVKLYAARGYTGAEMLNYEVGPGETIEFIPMRKKLD